ncbi:uncharacterized protein [Dysidea avara]|uniref:uncharacterized protein n=1 Tax=Dysidea avara TaxID=196820 RepID=UPI003325D038
MAHINGDLLDSSSTTHTQDVVECTLEQVTEHVLVKDAVIQLISRTSGKTMKIEESDKATVSANGYEGTFAQYKVCPTSQRGVISLQSAAFHTQFVSASETMFVGNGRPEHRGNKFIINETDDGFLQFESLLYRGHYITAADDNSLRPLAESKNVNSIYTHFILRPRYLPGMIQSIPSPAKNQDERSATPFVVAAFAEGNCICLKSQTSGRYLSISESGNVVTGVGLYTEDNSKFYVRMTDSEAIMLQSVANPKRYLCIADDLLSGQGSGGRNCHFYLYDNKKQRQLTTVSFESVPPRDSPVSLCVGIAANGMSTIPSATSKESDEAHFYVSVLQLATSRTLLSMQTKKKSKQNSRSLYAGPSIMSKFRGSSRIQLISMATSQPVWVDGIVSASPQGFLGVHKLGAVPVITKNDTRRLIDQFTVHVRRPGIVALQNAKSRKYLGIKKGDVLGDGEGDAYCNFTVTEDERGAVTLESELYLDQFLGFYPNGATIPPTKVDLTNPYSNKFFVRVMNIPGTLYPVPSVADLDPSLVAPIIQVAFQDLAKIHLKPKSFSNPDSYLRVMDDASINCQGKDGDLYATFIVHSSATAGVISLQNAKNTLNWLAIRDGKFIGDGEPNDEGNDEALFKLVDKGGGLVSFESAASSPKCHQCYITVKKPNGVAGNTKRGLNLFSDESVFEVCVAQLPKFYDGAKIILFSKELNKAIRIMPNGEVNCLGGHGMKAQFFVHGHQHKSGVVTLQNAMFPDKYLRISEGKVTVGSGKEMDCEFKFHEKDGFVAFESALQKGHYLGVLENGQVKQPVKVDAPNNYDLFDIKNAER